MDSLEKKFFLTALWFLTRHHNAVGENFYLAIGWTFYGFINID